MAQHPPRYRASIVLSLGVGLVSSLACTAILTPRDDVQRCGSTTDCDPPDDARFVVECRFDEENIDLDSTQVDKVCVPEFRDVNCDPRPGTSGRTEEDPLVVAFDDLSSASRYTSCSDEGVAGTQGCPPAPGEGCADGLVPQEREGGTVICDDEDPNTPPATANRPGAGFNAPASDTADPGLLGQDVLDQYCKSFFCDDQWVCDRETFSCVQCDPELPIGLGGCGQIYIEGSPSCVYIDGATLEDTCDAEGATAEELLSDPSFGSCQAS